MPLFMLVSGYLFALTVKRHPWKTVIGRKTKAMVFPILSWSLVQTMLAAVKEIAKGNGLDVLTVMNSYFRNAVYSLWFLWAVLLCSIIVALVHHYFKDNIWVYAAIFVVSFVTPDVLNLHMYKYMYPYFVIGYFVSRQGKSIAPSHDRSTIRWMCISGIAYIGMLTFFSREAFIYTSRFSILTVQPVNQILIDLYRFGIGFAGSVFVIFFLQSVFSLLPSKAISHLCHIGTETMGIYIISNFFFSFVVRRVTYSLKGPDVLVIVLITVVTLLLCMLAIKGIRKIPCISRLLLGGSKG